QADALSVDRAGHRPSLNLRTPSVEPKTPTSVDVHRGIDVREVVPLVALPPRNVTAVTVRSVELTGDGVHPGARRRQLGEGPHAVAAHGVQHVLVHPGVLRVDLDVVAARVLDVVGRVGELGVRAGVDVIVHADAGDAVVPERLAVDPVDQLLDAGLDAVLVRAVGLAGQRRQVVRLAGPADVVVLQVPLDPLGIGGQAVGLQVVDEV